MIHENLKNKVIVITGGGGVLCGGFAKDLARQGVKVAVLDLREESANLVAEEIKAEETVSLLDEINLPDDTAYGAKIIGKIVLSAAEYCNSLTTTPTAQNTKELVNLILGRSEVAKAEILKIVAADADRQSKILAMESELKECEDYFKSVMAQK
jgi:NAD(P)-dependent dehydrogenase (short-subunit alcohol dehydrogenase family)